MPEETAECIFCQIIAKKIPSFRVYEDDRTLAFADINPLNDGHILVTPKTHTENLMEITPGDLAAVHQTTQKVARAMVKGLGTPGVTVLQLNGKAANQIVMHYHVHLIPRNREKDGLAILERKAKPGNMRSIERYAKKVAEAM